MKELVVRMLGYSLNLLSFFSPQRAANLSLTIFTSPRKGKILESQSAFLNSAKKEYLSYDEIPIMTYYWEGNNKTILLAHGWESNSFRWKNLITELQRYGYSIVALDAPAHGDSGSKMFNAILYSEFINIVTQRFNPDVIVGHSVGGMASVFSQHQHSHFAVKKMVLLGAPARFSDVLQRYVDMMGFNKKIHNQLRQVVNTRFGNFPDYYSTAQFAESLDIDGLIIHDVEDKIIPYSDGQLIAKSYGKSRFISTTGIGHGLRDKSINSAILDFIIN